MKCPFLLSLMLLCACSCSLKAQNDKLQTDTSSRYSFQLKSHEGQLWFVSSALENGTASIFINGNKQQLQFAKNKAFLELPTTTVGQLFLIQTKDDYQRLYHISRRTDGMLRVQYLPLWLSILPPLIAIVLALLFKEVVVALFLGVWSGAFIAGGLRLDSWYYFLLSVFQVAEKYITNALNDGSHISIFVFSLLIGGMVAIISRNGGMAGIVKSLSQYATSPRSAQLITWLLGIAIFFDDYTNTLIVGNTMRPVTDRFRISREKLAYIVDSTAAPVVVIAFVTTWIGAELSYIDDGIQLLDGFRDDLTPYAIFIQSLKYAFYPVFTLFFILLLILTKRDYGSMYTAECRARQTGNVKAQTHSDSALHDLEDFTPIKNAPLRWYNAFIPVAVVILMTIFGLIDTGFSNSYQKLMASGLANFAPTWTDTWQQLGLLSTGNELSFGIKLGILIGNADTYIALLWSSITGLIMAVVMTVSQRIMSLSNTITTMTTGFKAMLPALLILTLAWALAMTTQELHTAAYLTASLKGTLSPYAMPVIVFILSVSIAFSTGSSWSTMAILYPIVIPMTWTICQAQSLEEGIALELLFHVIAVVLSASVIGDHCSPISDTTILSSLASDCNHMDHVRTQLPYALTVGGVSLLACITSSYLGGGWLLCGLLVLIGWGVLSLVVFRFGRKVPTHLTD